MANEDTTLDGYSRRAQALIVLVTVTGAAALVVMLWDADPVVVVAYIVIAALLQLLRVSTPNGVHFSVTILMIFAALLLDGTAGIAAATLGAGGGDVLIRRNRDPVKNAFNTGALALCSGLASVVFHATGGEVRAEDATTVIVPVVLAIVAYSFLNLLLLAGILAATAGLRPADLLPLVRSVLVIQPMYSLFALIGYAVALATHPLLMVLAIVPMFVVRQAGLAASAQKETFDHLARAFAKAIEVKDGYTSGHGERVAELSVRVGRELRLSARDLTTIEYAALLHDVGKIGVSLGVLCKNGRLTEDEYEEMKIHPSLGADLLRDVDFLDSCLPIVRHHHERPDGRGYPDGLLGQDIPLLTRIVSAVDAFDAMTSTRSYRRAMAVPLAIEELHAHTGPQFDADVVAALVRVVERDGWTITDERVQVAGEVAQPRSVLATSA